MNKSVDRSDRTIEDTQRQASKLFANLDADKTTGGDSQAAVADDKATGAAGRAAEPPTHGPEDGKPSDQDRMANLSKRDFESKLEQRERKQKQERKEAADRRSQLLGAVRVTAPDISKPLVNTLEKLSISGHKFADKELVRLMKNDAQLQDSRDFFDLNLAEREDLLDRVGFYKGIVIDHSLSNPVESGFREVLKRQDSVDDDAPDSHCRPAVLLYRKPNFAGYFENYFSSSESEHQLQQNGVTDVKASIGVAAGGMGTRVGVGASGSYFNSEQDNTGSVAKKIHTTANFFLPKVELSFDDFKPCASDEFLAACEDALSLSPPDRRFAALLQVLASFGHFVSTQTLVGGRLFATETKTFTGTEKDTNVTTRFAAQVKASVSSYAVDVEAEASVQRGNQSQTHNKGASEEQAFSVQAVGGEGAVAEQAGRWAESLYDYRRWAAVQREKLVPSIDVLPPVLRALAWDTLMSYARQHSALHLIGEHNAYFMFYGRYGNKVGVLTQADLIGIRHPVDRSLLMVRDTRFPAREGVQLEQPSRDALQSMRYVWRMTADGHIISMIDTPGGIAGRSNRAPLALTVEKKTESLPGGKTQFHPISLKPLGTSKNQCWVITEHGEIYNTAFGPNHLLECSGHPLMLLPRDAPEYFHWTSWQITPIAAADHPKLASRAAMGRIRHEPSGLVLSIDGAEGRTSFGRTEQRRIILQRDIGGRHQLWRLNDANEVRSVLSAVEGLDASAIWDVNLTADITNKLVAQTANLLSQKMIHDARGKRLFTDGTYGINWDAVANEANATTSGCAVTQHEGGRNEWVYEPLTADSRVNSYRTMSPENEWTCKVALLGVDSRSLVVNGHLTGIGLTVTDAHDDAPLLSLRVWAGGGDGVEQFDHAGARCEPDQAQRFADYGEPIVDERFLILPAEKIHSIRLTISASSRGRLAFEFRTTPDGTWHRLSTDYGRPPVSLRSDGLELADGMARDDDSTLRLTAIGLEYADSLQLLKPKALLRIPG
ncbi:hypothetical protein [Burkholderia gladioli]|uniref:hypothetical protein n=1 Tax=Burkholderia gladioli TaxID=28095 RepID=UPI001641DF3C|nr:hypothetical protein [Burkholderia gladioli]